MRRSASEVTVSMKRWGQPGMEAVGNPDGAAPTQ